MLWFCGFGGWCICCVGCGCYTIDSRGLGCYVPVFEFGFSAWGWWWFRWLFASSVGVE